MKPETIKFIQKSEKSLLNQAELIKEALSSLSEADVNLELARVSDINIDTNIMRAQDEIASLKSILNKMNTSNSEIIRETESLVKESREKGYERIIMNALERS